MPNVNYVVSATCQGVVNIPGLDVPAALKTTTQFVLISTGNFQAGDLIAFMVLSFT